jgi:phytoene dehydrogenase-like protein
MSMTRNRETMIIIGAGLGGLSTGCYAQMNGYKTRILEMHEIAGGCCTAWGKGDFTFDCCISWLLGSGPGNQMHQIWLELGALQGKQIRNFDVFNTVVTVVTVERSSSILIRTGLRGTCSTSHPPTPGRSGISVTVCGR